MKSRWYKIGLFIAAILLAVVALWRVLDSMGRSRFESYVEDLRSRGIAVSPYELVEIVPDEENALFLWREAQLLGHGPSWGAITAAPNNLTARAMEDPASLTDEEVALFLKVFKEQAPYYDCLRQIAECPSFGFTAESLSGPPNTWESPKLVGIIGPYRVLFCTSSVLASEGRVDEAVALWRLGVRSSRHFVDSPISFLSFMVGEGARCRALDAARPIFLGRQFDANLLCQIIRDLDPAPLRRGLALSYDKERAWLFDQVSRLAFGPIVEASSSTIDASPSVGIMVSLSKSLWVDDFILFHEHQIEEIAAARSETPVETLEILERDSSRKIPDDPFLGGVVPSFFLLKRFRLVLRLEAQSQTVRLALACKAYRAKNGRWPETLSGVAPIYIDIVPLDPYTEKPFVYEVFEDGFIVYSVGPNGVDDGGLSNEDGPEDDIAWEEYETAP